jgi:PAS domain S-box-containing protein
MADAVQGERQLQISGRRHSRGTAKRRKPADGSRARAERLQESAAQFRLARDALGIVTWVWEIGADRVQWHGDPAPLLGLEPGRFAGRFADFLARVHGDDVAAARQAYIDCLKGHRREVRALWRVLWPDGSVRWLQVYARGTYRADRRAVRMAGVLKDVTESKREEAARLKAEAQLARVFDASPDYIVIVRARDGLVLAVNAAFERVTGYRSAEIVGCTLDELKLWAVAGERERCLADLEAAGGTLQARPVLLRTRAGATFAGKLSASLFEHAGERLMAGVVHDIRESRRLERRASESERKFGLVFAISPDPMAIARESDGVLLEANEAWRTQTLRSDVVGRSDLDAGLWPQPEARAALLQRLRADGMVTNLAQRLRRADGAEFDALVSAVGLKIDGEPCILWNWRDVSAQRRLEHAQAQANARYRTLFESALDGMLIVTPQRAFVDANPAACSMTGYSREELTRMHPSQLFAQAELAARPLRDLGERWSLAERALVRKDGSTLPVEILGGPLPGGLVVAILRDVTQRKRNEALMRQANESLEELVRSRTSELEAANRDLESYSYSVSHDLRQPLNAIAGFAELLHLQAAGIADAAIQESIAEIEANAARMEGMIHSLMELARAGRRGAIRRREVDLRELVEGVLRDLSSGAAPGTRFVVGEMPPASGDPVLLQQVWANLVGNAIKYSRHVPAPRVEISARRQGDGVECEVRDNGVGFEMQHAERLFGAFQRLPSAAGFAGSGVGLAIVERIVRRHGGTVSAESAPGKGAVFRFTLPDKGIA